MLLDKYTTGYDFIIVDEKYDTAGYVELQNKKNYYPILKGNNQRIFKSRHFSREHKLIFKKDGTFIYSWDKVLLDRREISAGFSKGEYYLSGNGEKIHLFFKEGLHFGENHILNILSHRHIFYPFRGVSYFLR